MKSSRFRAVSETALSARQIVSQSFPLDRRNTRYVYPSKIESTPTGYACTTVTKIPGERYRTHHVRVKMPKDYRGKFKACPEVKIDCDCGRYTFVWNYALWIADAAIRDRTNHKAPVITNPGLNTGCCKHCLVVLQGLVTVNPEWPPRSRARPGVGVRSLKQALGK